MADYRVPATKFLEGLGAIASKLGYDTRLGPLGSVTYESGTNPRAVPMVNMPYTPGLVLTPEDREMTPEEVAHESVHVRGGFPLAMAGTVASQALGLGGSAGYMSPDEVAAYTEQPTSEATDKDMATLIQMSGGQEGPQWYRDLVSRLADRKRLSK